MVKILCWYLRALSSYVRCGCHFLVGGLSKNVDGRMNAGWIRGWQGGRPGASVASWEGERKKERNWRWRAWHFCAFFDVMWRWKVNNTTAASHGRMSNNVNTHVVLGLSPPFFKSSAPELCSKCTPTSSFEVLEAGIFLLHNTWGHKVCGLSSRRWSHCHLQCLIRWCGSCWLPLLRPLDKHFRGNLFFSPSEILKFMFCLNFQQDHSVFRKFCGAVLISLN